MPKRLFSGVKPSGEIHLGNYLSVIKDWVGLVGKYDCFFSVADYHAITVPYDTAQLRPTGEEVALIFVACGIDPEKATLFLQSDVAEHTELTWIFNCLAPMGLLERMTQYKDKVRVQKESVTAGLFDYPVLQAADILLYKAEAVPVGQDQVQHVEFTRDIARKFNKSFGQTFPEPKVILNPVPKILGLDGKKKMSKTEDNTIALLAEPEVVEQSLATAVTDENRKRRTDPGNPDICNLFTLHKLLSSPDEIAEINSECRSAGIGCVDCKKILAKNLNAELAPIREKYHALASDRKTVTDLLAAGAAKARPIAQETMAEVRDKLGIRPRTGG